MITDKGVRVLEVSCPTCKKVIVWGKESQDRPFCSKRCRLIDLGEWAKESYSIPVSEPPHLEDWPDEPPISQQ